jgi:hypothetical protein
MRNYYLNGMELLKRVLDMDGGGAFTTVQMYSVSGNCTLKVITMVNFKLGVF